MVIFTEDGFFLTSALMGIYIIYNGCELVMAMTNPPLSMPLSVVILLYVAGIILWVLFG